MMESSTEILEVKGKEYKLFLNRKGIVAWERYCKDEKQKAQDLAKKYDKIVNDSNNEINENTNPFEDLDIIDTMDEDKNFMTIMYKKLYWIMLYTNHKYSFEESSKIFDDAVDDYGELQLIELAKQMLDNANTDKFSVSENKNLKNLSALKPSMK